ncbi:ERAP1-like C-terminal domain-containing protein [Komagataeibacter swingsii]|uniref:Aminopeptidase n=2 Tax=Komagataeibacter swingsii TaxID=215220 RepID=A0A850P7R7_9PROT|nr:ERAP1-like C-terminal domain-containing protein [Komagataeibacter swingsii]
MALITGPLACLSPAHAAGHFSLDRTPGALPKTVLPTAYRIHVDTDMKKLVLNGHEDIDLTVTHPVSQIVLNQAGLKIEAASVDGMPMQIAQDEKAQTLTLSLPAPAQVSAGTHVLSIRYSGPIPQTPNGIYYDDYRNRAGKKKRMLVTQFEVADARRMFPCWDEPAFRATYQLNIRVPRRYTAVSNMPVERITKAKGDSQYVSFATTPRMSTYLLAVVAGDMAAVHGKGGTTPINVYAPAGDEKKGEYALHAATEILPYYNEYFGIPYPLPKLDLIAIPGNYEAGAMENWGAMTFIDDMVLFDPKRSSPETKELVYLVVAHEMAHQWSGDLVTMAWWNDIWLNEGFASWMEEKATNHFNPTWEIWPRQHSEREQAMAQDAQSTTHPIQQTIHDVSEASSAFDRISYQKGEQVIRMIENWLGEDYFRDGMRIYMKAHAYSNATSDDLWDALSQASGQDIAPVARSFVEQPGIPQVNVTRRCVGGATVLTLTQSRFSIHDPHAAPLKWKIPVIAGTAQGDVHKLLLGASPVTLRSPGCEQAIKINLGENGYYRTRYDSASLALLQKDFASFSPADRVNLLGDEFALFQSGQAPLKDYLSLISHLPDMHETDIAVLQDTIAHLRALDRMVRGTSVSAPFHNLARTILQAQMERLGWDVRKDEPFTDTLLRPEVIGALGQFGDQVVITEAQQRFRRYLKKPASLPTSLVAPVATIVGREATDKTYGQIENIIRKSPDTEQKLRFFRALAVSPDPALMQRTVGLTYSGAIPNGRIVWCLAVLARESGLSDQVWDLVVQDQQTIRKRLAPWSQEKLLPAVAAETVSPDIAKALLADPSSNSSRGSLIAAREAADKITSNMEIYGRARNEISEWISSRS